MKPTKEQFAEFIAIRNSGVTNMIDFPKVCALSRTGLTRETCLFIIQHFNELSGDLGVNVR